jgi:hypothetical protein
MFLTPYTFQQFTSLPPAKQKEIADNLAQPVAEVCVLGASDARNRKDGCVIDQVLKRLENTRNALL